MPCSIPNSALNWLQSGEFATGGVGGSSTGVLNRPLIQLLANDQALVTCIADVETRLSAIESGSVSSGLLNTFIDASWPVNSVFVNAVENKSPGDIYGVGTWIALGAGRVLIGAGSTTDINGEFRNYGLGTTIPAVAKVFTFTFLNNTNGYITIGEDRISVTGSPTNKASQVADHTFNSGVYSIMNCTASGNSVFIHMYSGAGDVAQPPVSAGSGVTISNVVVSTPYSAPIHGTFGGEYRHHLEQPELPAHSHDLNVASDATFMGAGVVPLSVIRRDSETGNTGADIPHNNVQPYQVVYMFRRVA